MLGLSGQQSTWGGVLQRVCHAVGQPDTGPNPYGGTGARQRHLPGYRRTSGRVVSVRGRAAATDGYVLRMHWWGSTPLSERLDPEDYRDVVRAYQAVCEAEVERFEGHIAQLLGDALLVYFGWPVAHEDDAPRAVRAGLGMFGGMGLLNGGLEQEKGVRLAIRIALHTGLAVGARWGEGVSGAACPWGYPKCGARLKTSPRPTRS